MGGGHSRQHGSTKNTTTTVVVQTNTEQASEVKEAVQEQVIQPSRFATKKESPQPPKPETASPPPARQNFRAQSPPKAISPTPKQAEVFSQPQGDTRSNQAPSAHSSQKSASSSSYNQQFTSPPTKPNVTQTQRNADKPPPGIDFSAPGYIDNPPPQAEPPKKANNHNTDINIQGVNQGDAILVDLSPSNTPRDSGQGGNGPNQVYGDRKAFGKEHFDSEKFRQANSKKNQPQSNNARPSGDLNRSNSGNGSVIRPGQDSVTNTPQKPKFMGPTKQVFSMEDEILLDEIIEASRA